MGVQDQKTVEDRFFSRKKLFYYSDGTVKYICGNGDASAAETDADWRVAKMVWESGNWKFNPFTGKLDYHSGVSAPGNYIASPTATNLRDFMIEVGLMSPAPGVPPVTGTQSIWQDLDDGNIWANIEGDTWEDITE